AAAAARGGPRRRIRSAEYARSSRASTDDRCQPGAFGHHTFHVADHPFVLSQRCGRKTRGVRLPIECQTDPSDGLRNIAGNARQENTRRGQAYRVHEVCESLEQITISWVENDADLIHQSPHGVHNSPDVTESESQ